MRTDGYVVVSGPPASGKSTLGPRLAAELSLPYLAKDTIKHALITELGADDVERSRRLGAVAMRILVDLAVEAGAGVLDGAWLRHRSIELVRRLPGPVVEVFCRCPQALLEKRFRHRSATRPPGHFDAERTWSELWGESTSEPVAAGWPVVEVDTSAAVDVARLAVDVRRLLAAPSAHP